MGYVFDTLSPNSLVQLGVNPDILHTHSLLRKLHNGLDGPGCPVLETAAMNSLVEVNGVLAGDNILECGAGLTALFRFLGCRGFGGLVSDRLFNGAHNGTGRLNLPLMLSAGWGLEA
jgi:hypothetical protein